MIQISDLNNLEGKTILAITKSVGWITITFTDKTFVQFPIRYEKEIEDEVYLLVETEQLMNLTNVEEF